MKATIATAAIVTTLSGSAGLAWAQSPGATSRSTVVYNVPATGELGPKSPASATLLAVAGSLVGPIMIMTGDQTLVLGGAVAMIAAPSAGRWYSNEVGTFPLLVRGVGATALVAGLTTVCWEDCTQQTSSESNENLLIGGALLLVGGTIYDIATAGDAARRYNRNHNRVLSSLQVAPMVQPRTATAGNVTGLSVSGAF
jgi:hypothetical protein